MASTVEGLAELYGNWPVEKLVRAAYIDRDEYAADAVQVMRQVLDQRGISQSEIDAILENVRSGGLTDHLNSIRGWLLVFVIHVAVVSTTTVVAAMVFIVGGTNWIERGIGLIMAIVGGYGGYCSYLLTQCRSDAPRHARWLMLAWALESVIVETLWSAAGNEGSAGAGRLLLFAAIWFPYLLRSKRVARVYARSAETSE